MKTTKDITKESKKYSIRGLKSLQGLDGLIIRCNLYYEKQKIAECFDDGNGGMLQIDFQHKSDMVAFNKFIEEYPEQKVNISEDWMKKLYPNGFEKLDDEGFVNKLITTELRSKDLKKIMKKHILFMDKKDQMLEVSFTGKPTITQGHIDNYKKKRGAKKDDVVSILNEMDFDKALEVYESHAQ